MKRFYHIGIAITFFVLQTTRADLTATYNDWRIFLTGYFKYEIYADTRQTFGSINDETLLYPEPRILDVNNNDINRRGQLGMSVAETRARLTVEGPVICCTQPSGVLEVDLSGREGLTHLLRARHAFISLKSDTYTLLAGHTWHPLYTVPYVPRTLALNRGTPFEVYSRNPQIRYTYHTCNWECTVAALSEIDFRSNGPRGLSVEYIRNAIVPELTGILQYHFDEHATIGSGLNFKRLCPRIVTNNNVSVRETVNAVSAMAFVGLVWPTFELTTRVIYAQNASEMTLIGGYAVHTVDPTTDERTYTPLACASWWLDMTYTGHDCIKPGLFAGYTHNLGARKTITGNLIGSDGVIIEQRIFGFANNIKYIARVAPRVEWFITQALCLAGELEFTRAAFGTITHKGRVEDAVPVNNLRLHGALYYYF